MDSLSTFRNWLAVQKKESRWCLLITADPDALASAMVLRTFLRKRCSTVEIRHVNEVTRPDNLSMIRYLRIPTQRWDAEEQSQFTHFALLDSQPTHHPAYRSISFSLVIDHHPEEEISAYLAQGAFCFVRNNVGATSTLMTRLLRLMHHRPGPLLATALLYGIRTDTGVFERSGEDDDLRAYHWLSKYANTALLRRICRSEYLRDWLPLFSRAFRSLRDCKGGGAHASLNEVKSADLLVSIADFFTKIHGLRWICVSGIVHKTVVVIFRGDGGRDMGQMAAGCFGSLGQGGGHRNLARAEFPLAAIPEEIKSADFVHERLQNFRPKMAGKRTKD